MRQEFCIKVADKSLDLVVKKIMHLRLHHYVEQTNLDEMKHAQITGHHKKEPSYLIIDRAA